MSAHLADIEGYVDAVSSGARPACEMERLACSRWSGDITRQDSAEFPFLFDQAKADKVIAFVELLPHVKGHWAAARGIARRIQLEGWQKFILANIFGWVRKASGLRRYRIAYVCVPRKNGKSVLAAGAGLYMLAADGEYGAEVYSGATSEKQAWEVFRPAKLMAERTPAYRSAYRVEVNAKSIVTASGGRLEPVIGKPGDGASPSCAIVDEFHEHPTDELYDTMVTGMGARRQPLMLVITTAGSDAAGPCAALQADVKKVLDGTVDNDELFGIVYGIDKEDDWTSETSLVKANPNFGVSVGPDFLRSAQRYAEQNARKQSVFKTKHLNVWVSVREAWMNMHWWGMQADPSLRRRDFSGDHYASALDLSSKLDITARIDCFRRRIAGKDHYYLFGRYYIPEETAAEPENAHYQGWIHDGHLAATDGNIIDYQRIEDDILEDCEIGRPAVIGFDPWGATHLSLRLQEEHGLAVIDIPQNVANLSDPMKQLEALVKDGRLHHDGNPCLAWMIGNVTARPDAKDNIYPRKESFEKKIDGAVAAIMALSRVLVPAEQKPQPQIHIL